MGWDGRNIATMRHAPFCIIVRYLCSSTLVFLCSGVSASSFSGFSFFMSPTMVQLSFCKHIPEWFLLHSENRIPLVILALDQEVSPIHSPLQLLTTCFLWNPFFFLLSISRSVCSDSFLFPWLDTHYSSSILSVLSTAIWPRVLLALPSQRLGLDPNFIFIELCSLFLSRP